MTENKGREVWLDGLKGFGILLVILGHVLSGYLDAWTFPEAFFSFYPVRTWIYSFHMPLFFLISGYTFTLAYWRDGKLRRDRFFRQLGNLLWVYVLFVLLQWCVKQAVPDMVNEAYDLEDLRRMFLEPLGNFWYIYVLFVIYVIAALTRLPKWPGYWLLLPGAAAVIAADLHLDWTELTLYRILYHFFFFTLGSMLQRRRELLQSPKLAGIAAMCYSMAAYFYFIWYVRRFYANWRLLIAVATCYLLLWLFRRYPRISGNRYLQLCGKHCLELYLLHTFFTAGFRNLLPLLGVTAPWLSVFLNFLLSANLCLGIALLVSRFRWGGLIFRPASMIARRDEAS